ncbi:MAG: ribonuclease HI [Oscillospiraceae bacterium]|jgi:ribonuclease HI|nr:ribonuclease HI [Oscillospiraceae bacterium]
MKKIELFCDGACSGNPGPGGWGCVLRYNGHEKELSGGEAQTTNNRMELTALLEGLRALKEPCKVIVTTDSRYVADGISKGWAVRWQQNGWRKADKSPALNPELWEALLAEIAKHSVTLHWVRGHNGHPENERCDALARARIPKS